MKPKFEIGQTVKVKSDGEIGKVVSFSYDEVSEEFRYKVTSREVDIPAREVIHGFKTCMEEELEGVKNEK